MENSTWDIIIEITKIVLTVLGLILGGKIVVMKISPKTKVGDIDMSNSEYIMEKHEHYHKTKGEK